MQRGRGGRNLLLKAVGLNKQPGLKILDATAGLMRDAFFMAKFGGQITAIERSAPLGIMIRQALIVYPGAIKLHFIAGNALDLIPVLPPFEVIYLDPMFREEKSAKAKKDLQFLQALHQDEIDDSVPLFEMARAYARNRVVVKRSKHAAFLAEIKPDWSYCGESTRFDVYRANNVQA